MRTMICGALALLMGAVGAGDSAAQTPAASPRLMLDLTGAESSDDGCRLAVLVENRLGRDVEEFAVEVAVFGSGGGLDRLLLLRFGPVLDGRSRVRQFTLSGTDCGGIGRVLVNDVAACAGGGLDPRACLEAIGARSTTSIAFGL